MIPEANTFQSTELGSMVSDSVTFASSVAAFDVASVFGDVISPSTISFTGVGVPSTLVSC
jgi:hypothetical protein